MVEDRDRLGEISLALPALASTVVRPDVLRVELEHFVEVGDGVIVVLLLQAEKRPYEVYRFVAGLGASLLRGIELPLLREVVAPFFLKEHFVRRHPEASLT